MSEKETERDGEARATAKERRRERDRERQRERERDREREREREGGREREERGREGGRERDILVVTLVVSFWLAAYSNVRCVLSCCNNLLFCAPTSSEQRRHLQGLVGIPRFRQRLLQEARVVEDAWLVWKVPVFFAANRSSTYGLFEDTCFRCRCKTEDGTSADVTYSNH